MYITIYDFIVTLSNKKLVFFLIKKVCFNVQQFNKMQKFDKSLFKFFIWRFNQENVKQFYSLENFRELYEFEITREVENVCFNFII